MTRGEAIAAAAQALADLRRGLAERTPRESAELAYRKGGPSVDDLEARIRREVFGELAAH